MKLEGKRVFVSGGAGVIGRELCPLLLGLGARVTVGDLKPRPADWPAAIAYREGDLNDLTRAEVDALAPEVFIHLAATFERSTESYEFWEANHRHNIQLSHHLMDLLKDTAALRRVVFASSYLVYAPELYLFPQAAAQPRALRETDLLRPRNLIGMAKLAHEMELQFLAGSGRTRATYLSARIFRGIGRGSRCVVSRWVRALLAGAPIEVYRPEGMFDYIYAGETAQGLLRLAESETQGVVNLGTGRARRVAELVEILRRHFPAMRATTVDSDIPFEASEADLTLLERTTGWRPQRGLEEAIPEIIAYEQAQLAAEAGAKE